MGIVSYGASLAIEFVAKRSPAAGAPNPTGIVTQHKLMAIAKLPGR
jgi:hypothetical protein